MRNRFELFVLMGAVAMSACGDDSGGDSGPPGRGSVACQDWQDAICDFAVGCGAVDRTTCDSQYKGVECLSDQEASECSNAFNDADCAGPPLACDISDIADPAPAVDKCNTFMQRTCELQNECSDQFATLDECLTALEAASGLSCEDAIAVELGYEDCLAALDGLDCRSAIMLDQCEGVIRALR